MSVSGNTSGTCRAILAMCVVRVSVEQSSYMLKSDWLVHGMSSTKIPHSNV